MLKQDLALPSLTPSFKTQAGDSDEDGGISQGGCGLLTYDTTGTNGAPWATKDQWKQIRVVCGKGKWPEQGFQLTKAAH